MRFNHKITILVHIRPGGLPKDREGNCCIFWAVTGHWSKCAASWCDYFLRRQGLFWVGRPKKLVSSSQLIVGHFPSLCQLSCLWHEDIGLCYIWRIHHSLKKKFLVISSQVIHTPAIFMPEKCTNQIFLKLKYSIYIFQWGTLTFFVLTCFLLLGFNSVMDTHIVGCFMMKNMDHSSQNKLHFASYLSCLHYRWTT